MRGLNLRLPRKGLAIAGYGALSCLVLVLYSSWNRPLWYDEMVYFVLGGFDSTRDLLRVVAETTTNVNQGVTGAYMLLDYWSLTAFGAHLWALRLPSLVFGVYFMVVSAVFLRGRGVTWVGVWALPVLLVGQQTLMYYVGEARTYMPLAAAVMGVLAYYFVPLKERRRFGPIVLGWSAVLVGVSFHPYFALYWPAIVVFAALVQGQWRKPLAFANPLLVVVGSATYFAIGSMTWLRGNATTQDLDPFFWLQDPLWRAITAQLFQGIYVERLLVVSFGILVVAVAMLSVRSRRDVKITLHAWWPPVVLVAMAWALALAISLVSWQQQFWIIPRQWIASIALVAVGIVWFWSAAIRRVGEVAGRPVAVTVTVAVGGLIAASAIQPALDQWGQLREWTELRSAMSISDLPSREDLARILGDQESAQAKDIPDETWVEFANANARRGGEVWSEFAEYYLGRDWTTFVLAD